MTIKLPFDLGVELCNWHSSMNDPIYAVGSSTIADKSVSKELLEEALQSLKCAWADTEINPGRYSEESVDELSRIIEEVELALMVHELTDRDSRVQSFFDSIPGQLQQAKAILASLGRPETNENLLLTLAANVPLTESEWLQANELYGLYRG